MKVYKFIFFIGLVNLTIPFVGVTFIYKQYVSIALAIVTIIYALIVRAIVKEKENFKKQEYAKSNPVTQTSVESKTIEDVVEMQEEEVVPTTPVTPKIRKPRKSKILVKSNTLNE